MDDDFFDDGQEYDDGASGSMSNVSTTILRIRLRKDGVERIRSLKYGKDIEKEITPEVVNLFRAMIRDIANSVATAWPTRSGASARSVRRSARVGSARKLDTLEGSFRVSKLVALYEFGASRRIRPRYRKYLAIPLSAAKRASGEPIKSGPRAWQVSYKTFVYQPKNDKSKKYIVYRRYNGRSSKNGERNNEFVFLYMLVGPGLSRESVRGPRATRRFRTTINARVKAFSATLTAILSNAITNAYYETGKNGRQVLRDKGTRPPDARSLALAMQPYFEGKRGFQL